MGLILTYQDGQTPLDPEQINGLKIKTISTQQQLNEFEQTNINEALQWLNSKRKIKDVLSEEFMIQLHKRMLGMVWKWAGQFRKTETNIGIDWTRISMELRLLIDDAKFWVEHQTFLPDEIAIRFKHRLVSIHCFPNGNGSIYLIIPACFPNLDSYIYVYIRIFYGSESDIFSYICV